MSNANACNVTASGRRRGLAPLCSAGVLVAMLGGAGLAQAQTASDDSSLTWHGITLYGIVDLGLQYDTHSAPFSDYFPPGSNSLVQKNDYDSPVGLTPSNLSQSRIGLSGNEPLFGDWAAVFKFETFFNPQSGDISDGLKSVALNNGKAATSQVSGVDTSIAGQLFSGAAYIGFASPTYGSFTFGRNVTLLADGISKYDPMGAAQAFSVIGFSGTTAGGGDTEDRRLDQSAKYVAQYGPVHLGAMYQFGSSTGATNTGYQLQIGASAGDGSIDAYYFKKYDAVSVSSLSADQVGELSGLCNPALTVPATPSQCYSVSNSLSATISDNTTFAVMGDYAFGPVKLYGGYEHIDFNNPNDPLAAGALTIGGYVLAFVNNTAYDNEKTLQVYWAGLKYTIVPDVDLVLAYYGYDQNSFATGKNAGCSTVASSGCSGKENAASILVDYRLTKRFDLYAGSMWSGVQDGLGNGFLNKDNIATTVGLRFKF
ncbi:MAG: porin [Steroidobacteraceae bacterium]